MTYFRCCILLFLYSLSSYANEIDFTAIGMQGMTVQFLDASIYNDGNQHTYSWSFGDGGTAEEQNPVYTYSAEGVYTVCLSIDGLPSICKENTFYISKKGIRVRYDDTIWPNGDIVKVSSPFGPRWKQSASRYDFHRGIDIPGNSGDPIVSMSNGVVHSAYQVSDPENPFSSTVVVISHTMKTPIFFHGKFIKRYYSISSHLNDIADGIQTGVLVKKGDFIGTVGQTGDTNFDHNHFEVRLGVLCSRESQKRGNCSSSTVFDEIIDPHVNPLLLLDYKNYSTNSLQFDIVQERPLQVKITSARPEIDFNRIEIVENSQRKSFDINLREGIDPENIDGNPYDGITIDPGFYTFNGEEDYELTLTFNQFDSVDTITVSDIWNNTSGVSGPVNEVEKAILRVLNPVSDFIFFEDLPEGGQLLYLVFDAQGALVKTGEMENAIPVENLSVGLYYLRLWNTQSGSNWFFKVLKR
ncbi:MAG: PKD domain-containing protein [Bacteroidota bacterium]